MILCSQDLPFLADHVIYMCLYLFHCNFLLSKSLIVHQHTIKMSHFSADHVIYICVSVLYSCILCCLDIASFISILQRRRNLRKIMLFTCVCICFCGHFILSNCCIFRQHTAKMVLHSADHAIYVCVFVLLSLCDSKISHHSPAYCEEGATFGRSCYLHVCVFVFVVILFCQIVASFVSILPRWCFIRQIMLFTCVYLFCYHFVIARCRIFLQHTAKITHLSADHAICMCVFVFLSFFVMYMSHHLLAYCQDIPSFSRSYHFHACTCFCRFCH